MVNRKIIFNISSSENLKFISGHLSLVENELDSQYKLIKSKVVEQIFPIFFKHNWNNREKLFQEVETWKKEALRLKEKYEGKDLKMGEICIVWNPKYEKQLVGAFKKLEKKLNKEKNNKLI